ncbi:MAG: polysaccharide biosynthesis C-terminal domain-containing protein [Flavobacteriales bacterium]|nr:polysaccharide biosynthesis C-terminal domain-containing protein [Flavobacteriales bacterium]
MTRPIIGTVASRVAIAAFNLLLVALAAQVLGLADVGRISLLVLGISFILLVNNVVGGGGLVYLEPRHGTVTLRWLGYGWAVITAFAAYAVARTMHLIPDDLLLHVPMVALLQSIASIHLALLLGRERFAAHNSLQVMRAVLLLCAFAVLLRMNGARLMDYVHACYLADGCTALLSGMLLSRRPGQRTDAAQAMIAALRQGLPAQMANALQLLNYRFSYYLMDRFQGAAALGIWSIATQLAESAWLVPKSLGTVLYARVSNMDEAIRQRDITLSVLKLSVGLALLAALVLVAVPEALFQSVFGDGVTGIRWMVLFMSPGLLAMAASQALSHYLSGVGLVRHNTIGSGIGLAVTLIAGYALIPQQGAQGAAITASCAYTASVLYQVVVFNRVAQARLRHFLPDRRDRERIAQLLRRLLAA